MSDFHPNDRIVLKACALAVIAFVSALLIWS